MTNEYGVGVSHFVMGLMASEPESGEPTYSGPLETSATNAIKWAPSLSNATADGDNKQIANISTVSSGALTWTGWGTPMETYHKIFGHELGEDDEILESFSDIAPYVGAGYIRKYMTGGGEFCYKAFFYHKLQAAHGDEEQTTQGSSLTLANTQVEFNASEPMGCNYRSIKHFSTEAAAAAWLDAKVAAQAG